MRQDKDNVLAFIRDKSFYARHGKMMYNSGDYMGAIRHFLSVPYLDRDYHDVGMCLADSYYRLQFLDNALVTYFLLLERCDDDERAAIYIKVSEIVFSFDRDLAKFYLSLARVSACDRAVIDEVEDRLGAIVEMERSLDRKIRDVKEVSEDLELKLLMEGKYDAVIELASKEESLKSPNTREAVALSFVSAGREKEGMEFLLSHHQELSITELCLLYMCLSHAKDSEKLLSVRGQILSYDKPCGNKVPLCLNILCLAGDADLALNLARRNLDDIDCDPRALIMYAKLLMGGGFFDEAREVIVGIKNIDPYHRCIYDVLLDFCGKKRRLDALEVVSTLPYSSHNRVLRRVRRLFALPNGEWKEYFTQNKDAFYYVAENNPSAEVIRDFSLLVTMEDEEVDKLLSYVMLSRNVTFDFKKSLILSYYKESNKRHIALTVDDTIVEYTFPPLKKVAGLGRIFLTVSSHVIFFFVLSYPYLSIDFSDFLRFFPRIKVKKEETLLLSSYITFVVSRKFQPGTTLSSVLSHFMISESDFYAFLDYYGLEI